MHRVCDHPLCCTSPCSPSQRCQHSQGLCMAMEPSDLPWKPHHFWDTHLADTATLSPLHSRLHGLRQFSGMCTQEGKVTVPDKGPAIHGMILCSSNCQTPTWTPASGGGSRSEGEASWALTPASHIDSVSSGTQYQIWVLPGPAPTGCLSGPSW